MNQTQTVLQHMINLGDITRLKAMFDLDVQNLTARISDLRGRGIHIHTVTKTDARGTKYGEYSIAPFSKGALISRGHVTGTDGAYVVRSLPAIIH